MKKLNISKFIILLLILSFIVSFNTPSSISMPISTSQEEEKSDDVQLSISKNSTGISMNANIEFTLNVTNTLSESITDIDISAEPNDNKVLLSPSSNPLFEISTLEPGEMSSVKFIASLQNDTLDSSSADLVLIIDASGSMQNEINSVKAKLNDIIENFTAEMSSPRIGVIIHGWNKYSEYPMSSPNNSISLTEDFDLVKTFINSLNAGGSTEPWGDALYLANTWDWREDAAKLIIMIGDEDCDPGNLIGKSSSETWYNGSELLDIVTNLRTKGIIINTVVSDIADNNVLGQFKWIAEYTGGETVYLPDLEQQNVSLPDLIQEWTVELSREYSLRIFVNVTWEKLDASRYYNEIQSSFWLDLASPSIILSATAKPNSTTTFDIEFFADIKDFSPIKNVVLYHDASGFLLTYSMNKLENKSIYYASFPNVPSDTNVTYFVESSDVHGNTGITDDKWILAAIPSYSFGQIGTKLLSIGESFISTITVATQKTYYLLISGPATISSFDVAVTNEEDSLQAPILHKSILVTESEYRRIFSYQLSPDKYYLNVSSISAESSVTFTQVWINPESITETPITREMTEDIRVHGYSRIVTVKPEIIGIGIVPDSVVTVYGEVFYTNLSYLGQIKVYDPMLLEAHEHYLIFVWGNLRTGYYKIELDPVSDSSTDPYYTDEPETTSRDPYYENAANATSGITPVLFAAIFTTVICFKKKRKNRNEK